MCQWMCVCATREEQRQFYLKPHDTDVMRRSISLEQLRKPGLGSPGTRDYLHEGLQLKKGGQVREERHLCKTLPDTPELRGASARRPRGGAGRSEVAPAACSPPGPHPPSLPVPHLQGRFWPPEKQNACIACHQKISLLTEEFSPREPREESL